MSNTTECSLTAPEDRDRNNKWLPNQSVPPLSDTQAALAFQELNITDFTEKFPKVERLYADPRIELQNIGLISFIPAKGATPNENGVYGFAKLRGNFGTEIEASQRASFLIRNVDSVHQIFHTYVGRPFPLTNSSKYSKETDEIDIRREMADSISSDIKKKKLSDQREIQDMQEREQALKDDVEKAPDPFEEYITLKTKKAQITWTFLEHQKKEKECKEIIIKSRDRLSELDKEFPDFHSKYFDKYMEARKKAGLKETKEESENNFIKYMVEEVDLGF